MQKFFTLLFAAFTGILAHAQSIESSAMKSMLNSNLNGGIINWSYNQNLNGTVGSISAAFSFSNAQTSAYARLTDFGFDIPTDHDIVGIEAYITRAGGNNVEDEHVYIVKGGNIQTAVDLKAGSHWSANANQPETVQYGSDTQLWGTTWTPDDINSNGFGIAISVRKGGNNATSAVISAVKIVVHFQAAITLPVHFTDVKATKATGGVQLTWKTGTEENVKGYEIERSFNGTSFSTIGFVAAAAQSSYTFTDGRAGLGNAWFRVKSVDNDGRFLFSPVVRYNNGKAAIVMKAFPTQAVNNLTVQHESATPGSGIVISSLSGYHVKSIVPGTNATQTSVDVSGLKPGLYLVRYINRNGKAETEKFFKR